MWLCVGYRRTGENMTNHLWRGCLAASPWTINPGKTVFGSCSHSKPLYHLTAEVNNSLSILSLCAAAFIFFFHPVPFGGISKETVAFFFLGFYQGANRRQAGVIKVRSLELPQLQCSSGVFPFVFVTLCLPTRSLLLPLLTIPCPSASWRFQIKNNISLMPPSTSNPFSSALLPSLHLLLSSLSFLLPWRVGRLAHFHQLVFGICELSLGMHSAGSNWMLFHSSLFLFSLYPPLDLKRLSWTLLSHETGGELWYSRESWLAGEKKGGGGNTFHFISLLSRICLFFRNISTKIPSQLLFVIKIRTMHLLNPVLCLPVSQWSVRSSWHWGHYSS